MENDAVLQNPTIPERYIPRAQKHEQSIQLQVCSYLRLQYPHVIFRSDYASGLHLTKNQAQIHKRLQSSRSFPDLFIYEPTKHKKKDGTIVAYAGMALELKADGTSVVLKIGERKGRLSTDPHIQEQALMLNTLISKGFYANFAVGYDEAVKLIDWYFGKRTNQLAF